MKALFTELIPRIEQIALDGVPQHIRAFWVTGLKKLPIQYRVSGGA